MYAIRVHFSQTDLRTIHTRGKFRQIFKPRLAIIIIIIMIIIIVIIIIISNCKY